MVVDAPDFDPTLLGHTSTIRSSECHAVVSRYPDGSWPAVQMTECGLNVSDADPHDDLCPRKEFIGEVSMCRDCWPEVVFSGNSDAE